MASSLPLVPTPVYAWRRASTEYGISVAPRLWYLCILKALKGLGFKQSAHDPCLLFKKCMIVVLYVDNAGIGAESKAAVNELVQQLKDLGFELTSHLGRKFQ